MATLDTASITPADEALVLRRDGDGVATLTLNRPRAYNALSLDLMQALIDALDEVGADRTIKAVVLAGAGKGFCAGHDLKELRANASRPFYEKTFELCSQLMLGLIRLPQPVIARVHGIATAAGCQLVATCDLAVAAEDARFATPGVNIGLFCSTPMVALSRAVGRKQAMEMLLLGEMVPAAKAVDIGLINRVVPADALVTECSDLAAKIVGKSPLVIKTGKEAFYRQIDRSLEEAYTYTAQVMTENMMARDAEEGIDAFIEKRKPAWSGQ